MDKYIELTQSLTDYLEGKDNQALLKDILIAVVNACPQESMTYEQAKFIMSKMD